jgi:hypothetical protein
VKKSPKPFFVKTNTYMNFVVEKSSPKILATWVNFRKTDPSNKLPNNGKFAQSGHPALIFSF